MSDVVIEFTADPSRCIGVKPDSNEAGFVGPGTPVELRSLTDPVVLNVWNFNATLGAFILDLTDIPGEKRLALDFAGGKAAAETPLVVNYFTGALSQRWSLTIRPGYITSLANRNLVIDDHFDSLQSNNMIWGFPYNGTQAQRWTVRKLLDAVAAKAPRYA